MKSRAPSGFGLGTSLGTPFTIILPWLFHTLSHSGKKRIALVGRESQHLMKTIWRDEDALSPLIV